MSAPEVDGGVVRYHRAHDPVLDALLDQMVESGLGATAEGVTEFGWHAIYDALDEKLDFGIVENDLSLPEIARNVSVAVAHEGGLTDAAFSVRVEGFARRGIPVKATGAHPGTPWFTADGVDFLVTRETYELLDVIAAARRRDTAERSPDANRRLLARVRGLAEAAGASLDVYLSRTRVLMPDELLLNLAEAETPAGRVVTLVPGFDGEPDGWLETFDAHREVSSVYRVPDGPDYWEIVVESEVHTALAAIKRIPGRRVAGAEAQRLLSNPFAYFGPDVASVFDEGNIEHAVAQLRKNTCRFIPQRQGDDPSSIAVLVEPIEEEADIAPILETFARPEMLRAFCRVAAAAVDEGLETFEWRRHELVVDGETSNHLEALAELAKEWVGAEAQPDEESDASSLAAVDLSLYSDRVEGIGIETPYSILVIPRSTHLGAWLPEDEAMRFQTAGGTSTATSLTVGQIRALPRLIEEATRAGLDTVVVPGVHEPIAVEVARDIVSHAPAGSLEAGDDGESRERAIPLRPRPGPRQGLLIASNIDNADYVQGRADRLAPPPGARPSLPTSVRDGIVLKAHQEDGVAWLQHLIGLGATNCRGALLADDMGLGKTLQLLAVALRHLEDHDDAGPVLVIAPVTLLENWRSEITRFFDVPPRHVLALYGDSIRQHRAGPADVDSGLYATGRKLLRDGWLGDSRFVLTTYETVRDLEFSLAEVDWSIVICDEAQKIKNPSALISRATKKLKAEFRVAATGTPVENSLADIWSIFDFIQPGLLPPLNRFGREYQRPIEARTDAQQQRLETLRVLLAPQIMRRTKAEVARDLPPKQLDTGCRELVMSGEQQRLYERVVAASRATDYASSSDRALSTLNVLRHLRHLCCDPRPQDERAATLMPIDDYRRLSPKFDWLVATLGDIRALGEKAIVFVEAKDIQRQLKLYLDAEFDLGITIVNGDSSTVAGSEMSRQKLIDRFQSSEGFNVIILSPLAAGVGLNIQAANHVIHYMRHWNPAREDQATDRAYRIGQERPVSVYTPIVKGSGWASFDERLDELLEFKRELAQDMYNGADDIRSAELEDLLGAVP